MKVTLFGLQTYSLYVITVCTVSVLGFTTPNVKDHTNVGISSGSALLGYVPSGFTPESYAKFKAEEQKKKQAKKNLGGLGPRGFKSRSMQSFQEALERGEAKHLVPVFNAEEKIKKGIIRPEDVPYMQRGGSWDNTDVKNARNKKRWLKSDKDYSSGGYKKEQSVSIFGYGDGLDWTGKKSKKGPTAGEISVKSKKFSKNYKPPNVNDLKKSSSTKPEKKGPFGWF